MDRVCGREGLWGEWGHEHTHILAQWRGQLNHRALLLAQGVSKQMRRGCSSAAQWRSAAQLCTIHSVATKPQCCHQTHEQRHQHMPLTTTSSIESGVCTRTHARTRTHTHTHRFMRAQTDAAGGPHGLTAGNMSHTRWYY
jgi:hypothetical protein